MYPKIMVLISTYNGEMYLREQLDSILNQIDVNVKITVRDDGSTDSTCSILEEYKKNGKIEYYAEENLGYQKSFLKLASYCINKAEYYAFCDQDDVWEPSKLIVAIKKLEEYKKTKYKLYFSNLNIVDKNLNPIGFKDFSKMNITLGASIARNSIAGCTMVFSNELLEISLCDVVMNLGFSHDSWLYRVCLCLDGQVIFDKNSYIKFRRHNYNVTNIGKSLCKRIYKEFKSIDKDKNIRFQYAEVLLQEFKSFLSNENYKLLNKIVSYKNSFFNTLSLMFNKNLDFGSKLINIKTRIEICLRKF